MSGASSPREAAAPHPGERPAAMCAPHGGAPVVPLEESAPAPQGVPPDVAARLVRAIDRSPSMVVTLVDADLNIRWLSQSATWVTGSDPTARRGVSSLERIHPDDVDRLLQGLAQLRAAHLSSTKPTSRAIPGPVRYRFRRMDGTWVVMEATIHNLLDDPVVNGFLVFSRPVSGGLDGVGYVMDLLVANEPLPDVLAACADLVPSYLGSAAVVALGAGDGVVGVPAGGPAERLAHDRRWWAAALDGEKLSPLHFAGYPDDLAAQARAEGFRTAWVSPLHDHPTGELIGCVVVWVRLHGERDIAADEALRHTERFASLVIAEERRRQRLERQALTDPLTGLANRSAFERRLGDATGPVTVAIIDLDEFKPVNDTHGHESGDAVLQVVAERLRRGVREADLAVRFGGDEFAIVFAEGTAHEEAVRSAARVVRSIEHPVALDGTFAVSVSVGASVGVATAAADQVAHQADSDLYNAKRAKRGDR